ncbi:MAG: MBL fold metallo-hydrolase [Prevotellaceae bacterium]|nr:MBL fold metallo-hydrolase [Prevotellaceae bacterium]
MRIIVHRGSNQIGGCITEISTEKSKLLIDLGHNLPQGDAPAEDCMASEAAVHELCKGCDAIVYTHYHSDHIDLFQYVPDDVPQYIGSLAKQVMCVKLASLLQDGAQQPLQRANLKRMDGFRTFEANRRFRVGEDIWVTPYFVSHSAADAYMFLVEADGKCVLHTGDFRAHGYLGKKLIEMLEYYVATKGIDVLICEGTMLNGENNPAPRENEVKLGAIEQMRRYKNVFVFCSSTDMERLASFHAANMQMGNRPLICDEYQKKLLEVFSNTAGRKSDLFLMDYKVVGIRKFNDKLLNWMGDAGFTMLVRTGKKHKRWVRELLPLLNPEETVLIYSMFRGYILPEDANFNPRTKRFVELFPNFEYLHTSGHADRDTLAAVCRTIRPREAIIPIHREENADFATLNIGDELRSRITTSSKNVAGIEIIIRR